MTGTNETVKPGDIIEFTLGEARRTAEAMLVSDGVVLLDLFDGDRPAWAHLSRLDDVVVFTPDGDALVAA